MGAVTDPAKAPAVYDAVYEEAAAVANGTSQVCACAACGVAPRSPVATHFATKAAALARFSRSQPAFPSTLFAPPTSM